MENLDIETLSVMLGINLADMTVKAAKINKKHKLGIEDFYNMTRTQYDVIRAIHDQEYLVFLLGGSPSDCKYDYKKSPVWINLIKWMKDYDLNQFSTSEIKESLPVELKTAGIQTIAAAMRSLGYENKRMYVGEGPTRKQARLWYKYKVEAVTFL